MRTARFTYTLAALDADGFANDLTGAGPFTTFSAPGDGTAHQSTLASAADLHLITMTVVGTDANGNTQTESIAGPQSNTVNLTKYFKTITSITPSATLGANTMDVGWTALCQTPIYVTDPYKLTGPLVTVGIGGTCTFTAQQSNSDMFTGITPTWATLGTASSTATAQTIANAGTTGVRVTVASHTSGVITLDISQARV